MLIPATVAAMFAARLAGLDSYVYIYRADVLVTRARRRVAVIAVVISGRAVAITAAAIVVGIVAASDDFASIAF